MIPQISSALSKGFTSKQIIDFLIKKFPEHADKIKTALASGYTVDQVLKYLGGGRKAVNQESLPQTEYEKTRGTDIQRRETANKAALATVALPATGLASQAAGAALSRAVPHALQSLIPGIQNAIAPSMTSQSMQPSQQLQAPSPIELQKTTLSQQPPIGNQVTPNISQPQPVAQPEGIINPREYLEKLGVKDSVDTLLAAGNTPEQAATILSLKVGKGKKGKTKSEVDPELLANIDAYAKTAQEQPQELAPVEQPSQELDEAKEVERPKIAKNETVASPHGVGEVREIRGGQAIINVDGKLHKVKEDELEAEPEEVREAKFDFDPDSVPEDLRSAPLNEVYTPADRRHVTVKYNAGLKPVRYIYFRKDGQPISEDYVGKIKKGIQLPVSSGLSFWGVWNADESDSRGAANYEELVSNAQEEGQEDDPSKEYWFIKEEAIYEHPYMEKAGKEQLRAMEKAFNEKNKKPRKKKKA